MLDEHIVHSAPFAVRLLDELVVDIAPCALFLLGCLFAGKLVADIGRAVAKNKRRVVTSDEPVGGIHRTAPYFSG